MAKSSSQMDHILPKEVSECGDGDYREKAEASDPKKFISEEKDDDAKEVYKVQVSRKKNIYSHEAVPLNTPWTFWVDRSERGVNVEQFEANLKRIYTVYTVQRFWAVYYNIPEPLSLHNRSSLHMMRDERKPVWEEAYNCKGGTFRLRCPKKDTDKVWRELLMAAIGEQLNEYVSENDEICGISVSVREREDLVLIWNTNASEAINARIFDCVHMLLPDTTFLSEFYKPHETHHAFEKTKKNGGKGNTGVNYQNSRPNAPTI